jgi:16S rRNA (cytidine1402-2'-O)-methyltransferase
MLEEMKNQEMTSVIYESPYRLVKTLRDILDAVGDREATVCRELTKKFEEIKLGTLSELSKYFLQGSVKGEFIIILSGSGEKRDAVRRIRST